MSDDTTPPAPTKPPIRRLDRKEYAELRAKLAGNREAYQSSLDAGPNLTKLADSLNVAVSTLKAALEDEGFTWQRKPKPKPKAPQQAELPLAGGELLCAMADGVARILEHLNLPSDKLRALIDPL